MDSLLLIIVLVQADSRMLNIISMHCLFDLHKEVGSFIKLLVGIGKKGTTYKFQISLIIVISTRVNVIVIT